MPKKPSVGRRIATATKSAGNKIKEAAVLAGDLNKDGKVDQEDAKIATAKAKTITSKVADKAGALAKEAAKHDMVKDAGAGAAIGAAVALPSRSSALQQEQPSERLSGSPRI
jgi:hypothetical protein